MNIRKLRGLRYVRRFNFHQCVNYTTVAEHSFFVALIIMELFPNDAGIVKNALLHDAEEACTGDIGYLTRKLLGKEAVDVVEHMARIELDVETPHKPNSMVDLADAVELKIYLEEERKAGNNNLIQIEAETMGRINVLLRSWIGSVSRKVMDMIEIVRPAGDPEVMTHEGEQWKSQ